MENILLSDRGTAKHLNTFSASCSQQTSCRFSLSVCFHSGHLRLSDFGLSLRLKRGGRAFTICGTIQYMGEIFWFHFSINDTRECSCLKGSVVCVQNPTCVLLSFDSADPVMNAMHLWCTLHIIALGFLCYSF